MNANHGDSSSVPSLSATAPSSPVQRAISRIAIADLFGQFSYDLSPADGDLSRLLILYGDNGSGKTTILKLLYHLLSPQPTFGHRSYIAKTRFRRFTVYFNDGTKVGASRDGDTTLGTFKITIERSGEHAHSHTFIADADNDIVKPDTAKAENVEGRFLARIRGLGIAVTLLPENRKDVRSADDDEHIIFTSGTVASNWNQQFQGRRRHSALRQAVRHLLDWVRDEAVAASNSGVAEINTIYVNIVKQLTGASAASTGEPDLEDIHRLLQSQSEAGDNFSRFGVAPPLDTAEILSALDAVRRRDEAAPLLVPVLKLYLASAKARLDALQFLNRSLASLIDNLTSFFTNKTVTFMLPHGLSITAQKTGEKLGLDSLSSGEQQLLLLFCDVVSSRSESTIFIVDEPELSLNIKWQRELIRALDNITEERSIQFVFATHSLELLSQHRRNVIQLTDVSDGATGVS